MTNDEFPERTEMMRWRRGPWLLLVLAIVVIIAAVWGLQETSSNRNLVGTQGKLREESRQALHEARGTAGDAQPLPVDVAPPLPTATVNELETITGSHDGRALVGQQVSLQVPLLGRVNDVAFWVGSRDDRVLVVLTRDERSGEQRQTGRPSPNAIGPLQAGRPVTITGTIRSLPSPQVMLNWMLTRNDRRALEARGIYIDAVKVTPAT